MRKRLRKRLCVVSIGRQRWAQEVMPKTFTQYRATSSIVRDEISLLAAPLGTDCERLERRPYRNAGVWRRKTSRTAPVRHSNRNRARLSKARSPPVSAVAPSGARPASTRLTSRANPGS